MSHSSVRVSTSRRLCSRPLAPTPAPSVRTPTSTARSSSQTPRPSSPTHRTSTPTERRRAPTDRSCAWSCRMIGGRSRPGPTTPRVWIPSKHSCPPIATSSCPTVPAGDRASRLRRHTLPSSATRRARSEPTGVSCSPTPCSARPFPRSSAPLLPRCTPRRRRGSPLRRRLARCAAMTTPRAPPSLSTFRYDTPTGRSPAPRWYRVGEIARSSAPSSIGTTPSRRRSGKTCRPCRPTSVWHTACISLHRPARRSGDALGHLCPPAERRPTTARPKSEGRVVWIG